MAKELHVLVRFGDLLSRAAEPAEIMAALADAAIADLEVDAVVVIAIGASGELKVGATRGCDEASENWLHDLDTIGPELQARIREVCKDRFRQVRAIPLASDQDLFGALVLLRHEERPAADDALAGALAGLAASGLSRAAKYAELLRSYEELRASREVLARSQKLRALGEMAAGVSHDLKNILNPLSLHLQLLRRLVPQDSAEAHESIEDMRRVLARGLETVDRLRNFARQTPEAEARVVDLGALGHEAVEIVRPRTRQSSRVAYRIFEADRLEPLLVRLDPAEAVAALVNLMVNAVDAMERGGTLKVESGRDGDKAWIRVEDDGPGMSKEVEARVFEPFFTTKGEQGTGLGLAMVYGFVQRHQGTISLDTAPGKGAAFTIRLPLAANASPARGGR